MLSFLTAMMGVYGVLSYAVELRRVEFGIRRALGASGSEIMRLVLARGLTLTAIGLPAGLLLAAGSVSVMRSLLFGVEPRDPATFALVAIAVLAVATLACIAPARRAARVHPIAALKVD